MTAACRPTRRPLGTALAPPWPRVASMIWAARTRLGLAGCDNQDSPYLARRTWSGDRSAPRRRPEGAETRRSPLCGARPAGAAGGMAEGDDPPDRPALGCGVRGPLPTPARARRVPRRAAAG